MMLADIKCLVWY